MEVERKSSKRIAIALSAREKLKKGEVTDDMNAAFNTDFGLKVMTLKNIRKNLSSVKRS
jgi:hypothetical protein